MRRRSPGSTNGGSRKRENEMPGISAESVP
jgi:hypothetical protein